jgi:hypothetical protein
MLQKTSIFSLCAMKNTTLLCAVASEDINKQRYDVDLAEEQDQ